MTIEAPYAVFSDCHFHSWKFGSYTTESGSNSRLEDTLEAVKFMCAKLKEQGGKDILFSGDMFHTRGNVEPVVINRAFQTFKELSDEGFHFHTICGNHDLSSADTTSIGNAMHALKGIANFNVYEEPTLVGTFFFVPWYEDKHRTLREINRLDDKNVTVICHLGLSDVVSGISNTLDPEEFAKLGVDKVYAGHFHNHKRFDFTHSSGITTVFSVGALLHQSFKDVGSVAGFLIDDGKDVSQYKTQAPTFTDFTIIPDYIEDTKALYSNAFVRVKQGLTKEEADGLREYLTELGALRVLTSSIVEKEEGKPNTVVVTISEEIVEAIGESPIVKFIKERYSPEIAKKMFEIMEKDGIDYERDFGTTH